MWVKGVPFQPRIPPHFPRSLLYRIDKLQHYRCQIALTECIRRKERWCEGQELCREFSYFDTLVPDLENMALDNPSYFTIPGGNTAGGSTRSGRFSLLRKHVKMGTGSSTCSNTSSAGNSKKTERYSTPPTICSPQQTTITSPSPHVVRDKSPDSVSQCRFRKSFRSLLRDPVQTQMLVLGMPRPSDVAPSNKQKGMFSKKDNVKSHTRNASTGKSYRLPGSEIFGSSWMNKSSAFLQTRPGIGSLPSIDDGYYNVLSSQSVPQSKRRHSIGAYFTRKLASTTKETGHIEEETCFSFSPQKTSIHEEDESGEARIDVAWKKKKCYRCHSSKGAKGGGMEDILIISSNRSQAADLWVQYLKTCFDQIRKNRSKPPFRILSIGIEDLGGSDSLSPMLEEKLGSAKLAIVILCPVFLEHIIRFPEHGTNVTRSFRPDRVLAMLLGIEESAILDDHKAGLLNYSQWKRMESVKDRDEKFVGDFLGVAMDIISKSANQQIQNGEKCHFMLMPKKVNKSQNKVLILLNEPITKEDGIKVKVIRNSEVFEIPSIKKRNPYTVIFRMPEEFLTVSMLVSISVEKNGIDIGSKLLKCESQLYALDQILRSCDSPIEFMCQALNIVPCSKEKLDDFLVSALQRNIPPNFNLLQTSGLGHLHRGVISKEEYPTLLHFAARYGLEKLSWMLLECPGGELACDIRNICELTPAEMAESAGHSKLANALCGYMQMTEFTSVYTYLKGMSDDKNSVSKSDGSDDYLNPRPLSETYQVPPSPRPLAQSCTQPPVGYMQMHSPNCIKSRSDNDIQSEGSMINLRSSNEKLKLRKNSTEIGKKEDDHMSKRARDNSGNGIQQELIEIINDFKNNVFTISEVEKLVENWRNRNDVQQSFREKQDQLARMREEYERVQQKLKEEMKEIGRPSPMERLRNFFRGKSKDGKSTESQEVGKKAKQSTEGSLGNRPASSLSIQSISSSSSGRLSTGSHCSGTSLGDSGTHSDPESERKYRMNECCSHRRTKDNSENYDVPPSPVSVLTNKTRTANGSQGYEIPPVQSDFKYSHFNGVHLSTPPPCVISNSDGDSQAGETFYYNLPSKECPAPAGESALHAHLTKASSKNSLQALEECAEKTEDGSRLDYMNLPQGEGRVTAKYVVIGSEDEEDKPPGINLPDYVNIDKPEVEISCK